MNKLRHAEKIYNTGITKTKKNNKMYCSNSAHLFFRLGFPTGPRRWKQIRGQRWEVWPVPDQYPTDIRPHFKPNKSEAKTKNNTPEKCTTTKHADSIKVCCLVLRLATVLVRAVGLGFVSRCGVECTCLKLIRPCETRFQSIVDRAVGMLILIEAYGVGCPSVLLTHVSSRVTRSAPKLRQATLESCHRTI